MATEQIPTTLIADDAVTTAKVADDAVTSAKIEDNVTVAGTSHLKIPSGTTAQRPGSPAVGMIRHNTTQSEYEVYNGSTWNHLRQGYSVEYLVVAGGFTLIPVSTKLVEEVVP